MGCLRLESEIVVCASVPGFRHPGVAMYLGKTLFAQAVPMAGGAVLQVDQAAPAHQTLLRHFRERCADANLDRHQRLRAGGDHQEETSSERFAAYAATDLVADALRE